MKRSYNIEQKLRNWGQTIVVVDSLEQYILNKEMNDEKHMEQILFSSDHKRKRECCFEPDLAQERDRHPVDSKGNTSTSITFCSKPRNGLTRDLAIEIYKKRPEMMGFKKSRRGTMVSCEAVAIEFGVTPKTIRDIWRGRTWSEATGHPQSDNDSRCVQT